LSDEETKYLGKEDSRSDSEFVQEALRLTEAARERNLTLRVMGATAIRIHCPRFAYIHELLSRKITDLDFMAPRRESSKLLKFLEEFGYPLDREAKYRMAIVNRCVLRKRDNSLHADLFFDELRWNHTVDLRERLRLDFPTITPSDLFLEKMQIVRLNEKDIKDVVTLLREHTVASHDTESVNGPYIASLLSKDWGFYYTVASNLSRVETSSLRYDKLSNEDREDVASKIAALRKLIEVEPKSLSWRMRARTGTSIKWYREVDELA